MACSFAGQLSVCSFTHQRWPTESRPRQTANSLWEDRGKRASRIRHCHVSQFPGTKLKRHRSGCEPFKGPCASKCSWRRLPNPMLSSLVASWKAWVIACKPSAVLSPRCTRKISPCPQYDARPKSPEWIWGEGSQQSHTMFSVHGETFRVATHRCAGWLL